MNPASADAGTSHHRLPFGCELAADGSACFRLWAPAAGDVSLRYRAPDVAAWASEPMARVERGWYQCRLPRCVAGTRYSFCLGERLCVPDPASRFQPEGVHEASEVVDARSYRWGDAQWCGRPWAETVVYELHLGCFSPEGNYAGAQQRLDHLLQLGVTAVELMPLAQTPGRRNWGYDGAYLFAPNHNYGRPDELKALIDAAHQRGLSVFLDVVYNHFGPEGNYLHEYAPAFFTDRHSTPWGPALNFDDTDSDIVRAFFIENALYWLREYHIDGLRLDAVHSICDSSRPDIVEELAQGVREHTPTGRHVHLILENDHNRASYLTASPGAGGEAAPYDAQWNDDIHHALHVILTGENSGYYADYVDRPLHHLGRCLSEGFAFQGDYSPYRQAIRGEPSSDLPPTAFVNFLQNHDQTGNRALGERLTTMTSHEALHAALAITLLAPSPPLLFMGEEWGARSPFLYFCDFEEDLAEAVREGRRHEFRRFPEFRDERAAAAIPDPNAIETFEGCRLDWRELSEPAHRQWLERYRDLLAVRHRHVAPIAALMEGACAQCLHRENYLRVRWTARDGSALSLLANLCARELAVSEAAPQGALLYTTHPGAVASSGLLPAWHARWHLQRS